MNAVNERSETSKAGPLGPTGVLSLPLLERVQIAAPCPARWEDMAGDDKVRHCELCKLNVHNLSAMTRDEAETLLRSNFDADGKQKSGQGRFCAILYRRADGTVLTQNCPVGLARLRQRARESLFRLAAVIGLTSLVGMFCATFRVVRITHERGLFASRTTAVESLDVTELDAVQQAMKAVGHESSTSLRNRNPPFLMGMIQAAPPPSSR